MRYIPHTEADVRRMLATIGAGDLDALFETIPEELRLGRGLDLPPAMSEPELVEHLSGLAAANLVPGRGLLSFLGAGSYRHVVPKVIDALISRSEFFTAYTPYQPEVSQGTLKAIFEYQTMVSELLGTEVANASMYDGATATAEAALMGLRVLRKKPGRGKVGVSQAVHPQYREVLVTYLGRDRVVELPLRDGLTDHDALARAGCDVVVVQQPNFLGLLEDVPGLAEAKGAAFFVVTTAEPTAFGLVEAPGVQGADVVCGEGQALGIPMSLGGPGVGLFGCKKKYVRAMPGRLVGQTVDSRGEIGYVLTLATREQHIRRERATSNICTNQGLCALRVAMFLSLMGPEGVEQLSRLNLAGAAYLREKVSDTPGLELAFDGPVYNEVVIRVPGRDASRVRDALLADGILAGLPLGPHYPDLADCLLVNVTELHRKNQVDRLVEGLAAA